MAGSALTEQEVMDDCERALDGAEAGLQGPHRLCPDVLPLDFFPLRLLLQPGGLRIELTRPDMLVGRHSEADIRLTLPDVSRRHCRFTFADGHWKIIDLNSLNGVHLNEERVCEANVYEGDRIRLGPLTFVAQLGQPARRGADANMLRRIADMLPPPETEERRKAS